MQFEDVFKRFDAMEPKLGYAAVIDFSVEAVEYLRDLGEEGKVAEGPSPAPAHDDPNQTNWLRTLGGIGQMWRSPELSAAGIPQHPSSLGQMLVLGGLGALGGNLIGRAVDWFAPSDAYQASRVGTLIGGGLGLLPGAYSAMNNPGLGKNRWSDSFYDVNKDTQWPAGFEKAYPPAPKIDMNVVRPVEAAFSYANPAYSAINVNDFQDSIWHDPRMEHLPMPVRAGASGLIQMASTTPSGTPGIGFVTPLDVAKVAVGMGSGLMSGWLVGKTMGALFGTGQNTQDLLKNTGMAMGALRTIVPVAFGQQPFSFG